MAYREHFEPPKYVRSLSYSVTVVLNVRDAFAFGIKAGLQALAHTIGESAVAVADDGVDEDGSQRIGRPGA